jgi:hypothetical protein
VRAEGRTLLSQTLESLWNPRREINALRRYVTRKTPAAEPGVWPYKPLPIKKENSFIIQSKRILNIDNLHLSRPFIWGEREREKRRRRNTRRRRRQTIWE